MLSKCYRGAGGSAVMEDRRGGVKSRNMYKGPMNKDNGVGIALWEQGLYGAGRAMAGGGEWGQL